ncbi:hypothetical protein Tco_0295307 [Tanacetum coccineum]
MGGLQGLQPQSSCSWKIAARIMGHIYKMDKSWMGTNRTNKSYVDGVATFIDYAVHNLQKMGNIDLRVNKRHLLMPCRMMYQMFKPMSIKVEEVQFPFIQRMDLSKGYKLD